jgi:hypothetical protein
VAGSCEYGDEPSRSDATELARILQKLYYFEYIQIRNKFKQEQFLQTTSSRELC